MKSFIKGDLVKVIKKESEYSYPKGAICKVLERGENGIYYRVRIMKPKRLRKKFGNRLIRKKNLKKVK